MLLLSVLSMAQEKSITLDEAFKLAATGNKKLQVQRLDEARQIEITREATGKLLPSIALTGTAGHYFDKQVLFSRTASASENVTAVDVGGRNAFSGAIAFRQPVWAATANRMRKVAIAEEEVAVQKTKNLEAELAYEISVRYYMLQFMAAQTELYKRSLSRNLKALDDSRALFRQGRGLKTDTLSAYIEKENAAANLARVNSDIDVTLQQFKRLIGLPSDADVTVSGKLDLDSEADYFLPDVSLFPAGTERTDIAIQKAKIAAQQKQLETEKAFWLPQLSIVGQYQLQAQTDNLEISKYNWPTTSFVGLQLNVPLFNGGSNTARIKQADISLKQENLRLGGLRDDVTESLAILRSKWQNATRQYGIHKKTVEAATIGYNMAIQRYQNGLATKLETTDAELRLADAEMNLAASVFDLKIITAETKKTLGILNLIN